jgi:NAD(P)-dependent dehydrogenase (short-subunit alcohol dehydrogenase family)
MTTQDFAGKTVLITGAGSGIGRETAFVFAQAGSALELVDVAPDGLERTALLCEKLGARVQTHVCDVSSADAMEKLSLHVHARVPALDVLVNNAGITLMGSVEDISLEAFDRSFDINVRGVFLGCRHAITAMKARRSGSIINIASVSSFKPMPELVAYNGSKAAVALMTKSIALHCAQTGTGVRCNSINPGVVRTAMLDKVMAQVPNPEELMNGYIAMHPIGRVGEPEDIAAMAVFLAGDESGFVTGSAFTVDGGLGL